MKYNLIYCYMAILMGCTPELEINKIRIDNVLEDSIESYIIAVPEFELHEDSRASFINRVKSSKFLKENRDKKNDMLYVAGDGTFPNQEFFLDRLNKVLIVKDLDDGYTHAYRFDGKKEKTKNDIGVIKYLDFR
jgi:hypothetical protein